MRRQSDHDRRVEELYLNPERAGLEDVVISAKEVAMRLPGNSNLFGCVDCVYFDKRGDLYLLEHKSNGQPTFGSEAYALVQLTRARLHFYEYLGLLGEMLYSHGEEVEVVR
jgi:hypothetical protein